jgi:beta-carotene 15,15'-dioxygenase
MAMTGVLARPVRPDVRAPAVSVTAGVPHDAFWPAVLLLLAAAAVGVPLNGAAATYCALALILVGGLPHGGYDLALIFSLRQHSMRLLFLFLAAYIAVAGAMVLLWQIAPLAALAVFLSLSAVHFGADWPELPDGLLRVGAGFAVVAAPALGQFEAVAALFVALAGPDARWLAQAALAISPIALLLTLCSITMAWRLGHRGRAGGLAVALVILLTAPPLIGFALFFALLHAPMHMRWIDRHLDSSRWPIRLSAYVLAIVASVTGWWVLPVDGGDDFAATAAWTFQLLAVLVTPHFASALWFERRLAGPT